MIRATVVVPSYNNAATIGRCLDSLERQDMRGYLEVIVVDDGSRDDSAARASAFPVTVIRQANQGPAAARNCGAAAAQGAIVLFLDSDCVAPPGWARAMTAALDGTDAEAAVGTIVPSTQGVLPVLIQMEIEERYARMRARDLVDFIAAPSCAVRRDCFRRIGGFNAAFRFNEDVELAYRLNAAGLGIRFVQDVPVAHAHQLRWSDYVRAKFWRGVWRMRLYRLYPRKLLRDDWTPQSLKLQMLAACLLPPAVLALLVKPALWPAVPVLLALAVVPGWRVVRAAVAALRPMPPLLAGLWATAFLLLRSFTLAASVIYDRLVKAPEAARVRQALGSTRSSR